jgi:hypothetical protein
MKLIANKLSLAAILLSISTAFSYNYEKYSMPVDESISTMNRVEIAPLSADEIKSMTYMREEEKLARDVYAVLYDKWNIQIFANIGESEQRHMDALLQLLTKYDLPDPVARNGAGVFTNATLQKLYNDLIAQGLTSLTNALKVGANIEDLDIFDLETALTKIESQDIRIVYGNLNRASRNHLRAFHSNLVSRGEIYVPHYISQAEFDSIVSSSKEGGGQHMKPKN